MFASSMPLRSLSTADLEKHSAGVRQPKHSMKCYAPQIRALLRRPVEPGQYTSEGFQRVLAEHGIECSMSRSGDVWDNAAIESFFSTMKIERIYRRGLYRSRDEAKADVFDYIERFYNPRRRHSALGYLSPMEFEKRAMQT
jgi:putative transposase